MSAVWSRRREHKGYEQSVVFGSTNPKSRVPDDAVGPCMRFVLEQLTDHQIQEVIPAVIKLLIAKQHLMKDEQRQKLVAALLDQEANEILAKFEVARPMRIGKA